MSLNRVFMFLNALQYGQPAQVRLLVRERMCEGVCACDGSERLNE